jgi:hypothetical protein
MHLLNLDRLFSDLRVSISFHFLLFTSSFLFFSFSLHATVALEPLDLEVDSLDLICALQHNASVNTRYVTKTNNILIKEKKSSLKD